MQKMLAPCCLAVVAPLFVDGIAIQSESGQNEQGASVVENIQTNQSASDHNTIDDFTDGSNGSDSEGRHTDELEDPSQGFRFPVDSLVRTGEHVGRFVSFVEDRVRVAVKTEVILPLLFLRIDEEEGTATIELESAQLDANVSNDKLKADWTEASGCGFDDELVGLVGKILKRDVAGQEWYLVEFEQEIFVSSEEVGEAFPAHWPVKIQASDGSNNYYGGRITKHITADIYEVDLFNPHVALKSFLKINGMSDFGVGDFGIGVQVQVRIPSDNDDMDLVETGEIIETDVDGNPDKFKVQLVHLIETDRACHLQNAYDVGQAVQVNSLNHRLPAIRNMHGQFGKIVALPSLNRSEVEISLETTYFPYGVQLGDGQFELPMEVLEKRVHLLPRSTVYIDSGDSEVERFKKNSGSVATVIEFVPCTQEYIVELDQLDDEGNIFQTTASYPAEFLKYEEGLQRGRSNSLTASHASETEEKKKKGSCLQAFADLMGIAGDDEQQKKARLITTGAKIYFKKPFPAKLLSETQTHSGYIRSIAKYNCCWDPSPMYCICCKCLCCGYCTNNYEYTNVLDRGSREPREVDVPLQGTKGEVLKIKLQPLHKYMLQKLGKIYTDRYLFTDQEPRQGEYIISYKKDGRRSIVSVPFDFAERMALSVVKGCEVKFTRTETWPEWQENYNGGWEPGYNFIGKTHEIKELTRGKVLRQNTDGSFVVRIVRTGKWDTDKSGKEVRVSGDLVDVEHAPIAAVYDKRVICFMNPIPDEHLDTWNDNFGATFFGTMLYGIASGIVFGLFALWVNGGC